MPVEARPLFRPDVLRPHLAVFPLPPHVEGLRHSLEHWAELLASGKADDFKEQELLPDFLTDFFCGILGYTRPADGGKRYTVSREKHVEVDGKFADAVLGRFGDREEFVVALEGKGPKDPLDRPFAGRRMSAVDQGYRYAINLRCDWIIVTSIRQTRLYYKGADQQTYERFDTEKLAGDDAVLKKFVFLLGAERVVPAEGSCHLNQLLVASEKVGRELTREFYQRYADMRQDAFEHLCRENAAVPPPQLLGCTQKLLDRILFCAFCKDRGLLPADTIRRAYEHRDPYNPRPVWENFRGLFRSVNQGNAGLDIAAYNGGLFADDPLLDGLHVPDDVCGYFRDLGDYDYRPPHEVAEEEAPAAAGSLIDVDILGHIFEQSITDLERLRNEVEGRGEPSGLEKHRTRRKKEGAFYTPAFITRYIVEQALGGVLKERFERLRVQHAGQVRGTTRAVLADPNVYDLAKLTPVQRSALTAFWEQWQEELKQVRLLDPACGSGAFLIEAFDQLHAAYQASNDRLQDLRGHRTLFDVDREILERNLYGVDLNEEAIEICRLSLWIKTAARGKQLTSLDHTIRVGNSVVSDLVVHPKAFDWRAALPEVFAVGGFDVVIGNPPYVRQEWISPYKPYLQQHYRAYDGVADLYVYFYELGLNLLRPGGRLGFVVTNKWMKAGYGEPLRRLFGESAWVESVVDFGHAKQIFPDADVFPSILTLRKPLTGPPPEEARVCAIPREQLRIDDLSRQIEAEGVPVPRNRFGPEPWNLEPPGVTRLLEKVRNQGIPLKDFAGVTPYRGILTGFNEAFLLDTPTKEKLVAADPKSAALFKPYLRGQDVQRWQAEWIGLWMLAIKSSGNYEWPWSKAGDQAEAVFAATYPAIHAHLNQYREALIKRQDQGEYWWELRACAYWDRFEQAKIIYQDITWRSAFCLDTAQTLSNNTVYFLCSQDSWLLASLNAPLSWWFAWRKAQHGKDEALRLFSAFMETFPIPNPSDEARSSVSRTVERLRQIAAGESQTKAAFLDWLRVEYAIEKPSLKLQDVPALDADGLVAEVRKLRGKKQPLSVAGLKALKEEHGRTVAPLQALAAEARELERQVSDLVNQAYGLTPEEVELMWRTAPPRMPVNQ